MIRRLVRFLSGFDQIPPLSRSTFLIRIRWSMAILMLYIWCLRCN